ncbi:MAG TPA: alpha/beta hydrolase [Nannocystaceae bacterium]|nr:alpha/beta hydrolase [Nannocystaceae bacterium]
MTLHTLDRGTGVPVVLVHSGGMSARQWRKLVDRLAATHRVVAPDLIGSGENPPWPADAPFHFEQDSTELAAIIDALGEPAHLVGHSYGGLLAAIHARRHPTSIRSLALYDPVAFGVLQDEPDVDALLADASALVDDAIGGSEAWFERFVDWWNGNGTWTSMPPPARAPFLRVGRKVYLEVKSLVADRTAAPAYAAIRVPTLLLTGTRTPLAERRVVQRLATAIPDARIVEIPEAGHMGPITHADLVNDAIVRHIEAS